MLSPLVVYVAFSNVMFSSLGLLGELLPICQRASLTSREQLKVRISKWKDYAETGDESIDL
jgi:hypothetical protein